MASFSNAKTTDEAHLVSADSITFIASMISIFKLSKLGVFWAARYGFECIRRRVGDLKSILNLTVEIRARWPSHMDWNGTSLSINASLYYEYWAEMMIDLRKSACLSFWDVEADDFSFVLMVPTTFGSDRSSRDAIWGALKLTLVDISSLRHPSTLDCRSVVAL